MTPPPEPASTVPAGNEQLQGAGAPPSRLALTRREFLAASAGAGVAAAALSLGWGDGYALGAGTPTSPVSAIGTGTTPEQLHLTWGANPSSEINVSWASRALRSTPQLT